MCRGQQQRASRVDNAWVGQAEFLLESLGVDVVVAHIDSDELHVLVGKLSRCRLQGGGFVSARRTPGRPDVEDDDVPLCLREVELAGSAQQRSGELGASWRSSGGTIVTTPVPSTYLVCPAASLRCT